ncbi:MAG: hypothetical protein V4487_02805, partial [Chlamydiota bacterium]
HKKDVAMGTAFGVLNAATFYLIASYIPTYFNNMLGLNSYQNTLVTLFILVVITILLPFFGVLGDNFKNKPLLVSSSLLIILLLIPLYYSINHSNVFFIAAIG